VLVIKHHNHQGNRSHARIIKVRKGTRRVTGKPLGVINAGCGWFCNVLACGALDRDYYYSYDVHYDDGIEEQHVPMSHIFASFESPLSPIVVHDQSMSKSLAVSIEASSSNEAPTTAETSHDATTESKQGSL